MAVFEEAKFDYDSDDNIIYRGLASALGTGTDESKWYVWKYIYDGTNISQIKGPVLGKWDERSQLF